MRKCANYTPNCCFFGMHFHAFPIRVLYYHVHAHIRYTSSQVASQVHSFDERCTHRLVYAIRIAKVALHCCVSCMITEKASPLVNLPSNEPTVNLPQSGVCSFSAFDNRRLHHNWLHYHSRKHNEFMTNSASFYTNMGLNAIKSIINVCRTIMHFAPYSWECERMRVAGLCV